MIWKRNNIITLPINIWLMPSIEYDDFIWNMTTFTIPKKVARDIKQTARVTDLRLIVCELKMRDSHQLGDIQLFRKANKTFIKS